MHITITAFISELPVSQINNGTRPAQRPMSANKMTPYLEKFFSFPKTDPTARQGKHVLQSSYFRSSFLICLKKNYKVVSGRGYLSYFIPTRNKQHICISNSPVN